MVTPHLALPTLCYFTEEGERLRQLLMRQSLCWAPLQEVRQPCRGHRVLSPPRVGGQEQQVPETRAHRNLWLQPELPLLGPRQGVLRAKTLHFPRGTGEASLSWTRGEVLWKGCRRCNRGHGHGGHGDAAKGAIADPLRPPEDGGCGLELAPPGELCSGKRGEFSQALRADSIFETRRWGGDGSYHPEGRGQYKLSPGVRGAGVLGWALLALPPHNSELPSE